MKRGFIFLAVLASLLCITGCSNNDEFGNLKDDYNSECIWNFSEEGCHPYFHYNFHIEFPDEVITDLVKDTVRRIGGGGGLPIAMFRADSTFIIRKGDDPNFKIKGITPGQHYSSKDFYIAFDDLNIGESKIIESDGSSYEFIKLDKESLQVNFSGDAFRDPETQICVVVECSSYGYQELCHTDIISYEKDKRKVLLMPLNFYSVLPDDYGLSRERINRNSEMYPQWYENPYWDWEKGGLKKN